MKLLRPMLVLVILKKIKNSGIPKPKMLDYL